jgi:predicted RNA-binding protein YlxR (DUF448 family)
MAAMKHQPERTCIGCREAFNKEDVVRIVAAPSGAVIDYREKLPGRAAYVCPRRACITKALVRENLPRALRVRVAVPGVEAFTEQLASAIREKIKSLFLMAAKAGRLAAGYSAVRDGLEKGRVEMLIFAEDVSEGTKEQIGPVGPLIRQAVLLTKDEMGQMLGREMVGVAGIQDRGFADALAKEAERLKGLLNADQ